MWKPSAITFSVQSASGIVRVPYARNLEEYPIVFALKNGPTVLRADDSHVTVARKAL